MINFYLRYIFLEFKDRSSADEAVRQRNNYKLDKQHTFQCNLFTDFDKYDNIPEEFVPPPAQPYKVGSLVSFLISVGELFRIFCFLFIKYRN